MKLIERNKKDRSSFFDEVSSGVKDILDDSKEKYILDYLSLGLSNRVLFEKFYNFHWPLWLELTTNPSSDNCRACPNPLLLNTSLREWQVFTNYLSHSEITIDRSGMISGPSAAKWSMEFWVFNGGKLHRSQNDPGNIKISRNIRTGEIIYTWDTENFSLVQKIAGSRSNVDEALISVELSVRKGGKSGCLFAAIRPYNNSSLGGVSSIDVDKSTGLISVNNKALIGFDIVPDEVFAGSGLLGDIDISTPYDGAGVQCGFGMATSALRYGAESGKKIFNFRLSLNGETALPAVKINYSNLFKEFALFTEMRLSEGIKADFTDAEFTSLFFQSRLSILNINNSDIEGNTVESCRKLYFFIYAFCRTGALTKAEDFFKRKIENFIFDKKNPVHEVVVQGSFLINACYEIFIHKRETGFLQVYYPALKDVSDYIYRFSVNMHSADCNKKSIDIHSFAISGRIAETIYIYSAVSNFTYLARCMGIFGDESKFKNEALRLQSLILDSLNREKSGSLSNAAFSLLSLPDKVLNSIKHDEYKEIVTSLISSNGFPIVHPLYGIDMFSSAVILNQFFSSGVNDSNVFFDKFVNYIDDFHIIPDYIDPGSEKGSWGEGNSKVINSILFAILRNKLFIDGPDRLELFPVPDAEWFKNGGRIRVEDAPSRYGVISFNLEILDNELRLSFGGYPKYLPLDILINIPYNTFIVPGDDFIVKKKTGHNYIISGWPSSVRFTTSSDPIS